MFSTLTSMISHPGWQDSKFCGALFFITEEYIRAESNEPSVSSSNSFWMLLLMSLVTYPCLSLSDTKSSFSLFFPHSLNIWNKFKNKYYISPISPAFSIKSNTLLKELLLERRSRSNCINQESAKIWTSMMLTLLHSYNLGLWEQLIVSDWHCKGTFQSLGIVACFSKMWGWVELFNLTVLVLRPNFLQN